VGRQREGDRFYNLEDLSGNLFRNFFEKSTWVASSSYPSFSSSSKLLFTLTRKFIFHLAFEKFLCFLGAACTWFLRVALKFYCLGFALEAGV